MSSCWFCQMHGDDGTRDIADIQRRTGDCACLVISTWRAWNLEEVENSLSMKVQIFGPRVHGDLVSWSFRSTETRGVKMRLHSGTRCL